MPSQQQPFGYDTASNLSASAFSSDIPPKSSDVSPLDPQSSFVESQGFTDENIIHLNSNLHSLQSLVDTAVATSERITRLPSPPPPPSTPLPMMELPPEHLVSNPGELVVSSGDVSMGIY
jgi:hypothetical protein